VVAALKESEETPNSDGGGEELERDVRDVQILDASHEPGGAIDLYGPRFDAAEIAQVREFKQGDGELTEISDTLLARVLRKAEYRGRPQEKSTTPLDVQKQKLREQINVLVRSLAIRLNPAQPDFSAVWQALFTQSHVNDLDDMVKNHDLETMQKAHEWLKKQVGGSDKRMSQAGAKAPASA
jgi:hypothetical protein